MTLFNLDGKVAVVTGASRGIGEAIAWRMAEHGAKVVVSSRKVDACQEVVDRINKEFGEGTSIAIGCNISYKEQLQSLVDQANEAFGKIDIMVCNAAVNPFFGKSQDIPDDAFDKIMGCNVKSNHWLSQMVAPQMAERGDGVFIIISSIGGLHGSASLGAYGISKAADFQVARNIAVEYGGSNVRANCIAPGLIKTYFAKALWDDETILKGATQRSPLKRIGTPDEIAGAAVFLASKAGAFMTGQQLVIDGGNMTA